MFDNIVIIGNPIAGGGSAKKIHNALDIFKSKGFHVELIFTEKKGDAESFAKEAAGKPSTLVIAAGGDGTYNEVANGLIKSNTPMAILPVGTTSVLARELKMPYQISKAVDFIINGSEQIVHTGLVTFSSNASKRHFLLMAGIGFDGEAVFGVNERIKKHTGRGGYILSGLNVLLKYNPEPIDIIAYDAEIIKKTSIKDSIHNKQDERHAHNSVSLTGYGAVIGKAACYGGDLKVTPHARLTDPFFYIFVAHGKSRVSIIKYLAGVAAKTHLRCNDISYLKSARVEVFGGSRVQMDGDYAGTPPIRIEVVPNSLKLIVNNY